MSKGKELTPKQKAFCDEYLIDLNGARAYKKIYKNIKNDATARANASRTLTKANIKAYIAERMKEIQNEKTADLEEVIRFFSSVMRGEVKDQFDLDATISDRLSAGRELMRWYEKADGEEKDTGGITIINNIPRTDGTDGGD
nr:MAG TPA: Terminase small subunit [Caudoviricetes sp.]